MDTQQYKVRLSDELQTLTTELHSLGIQDPLNSKDWVLTQNVKPEADDNVVADHVEENVTNNAILADLETRYNNVTAALAKIAAGTYGICEISGEVIEEERLQANPAARTCITHMQDKPRS